MYEPTTSLSLHRLSRHSLQDRYESDEEAVSESDAGAQDLLSSPIGSQAAEIFDSDLSADDTFHTDPVFDEDEHTILAPPTVKRPRPVSSATKRNSNATFDSDTYVFDPEEQLVLELPSPESSPEMAPRTFLQPSIYVWPNSPRPANSRSRSASPTSIFSIEEADIQVAKKVTIMEPPTRPTVVLINALGSRPKSSRSRPSHSRSRESSRIRPTLVRADSRLGLPRSSEPSTKSARVSERKTTMRHPSTTTPTPTPQEDLQLSPSATINRVSEIPPVLYFPAPPRTIPAQEYRTRPSTTGSDITMPPPLNVRSRRPPSMRSTSSSHPSRPTTPFSPENTPIPLTKPTNHTNHTDLPPHLARACSPASISSPSPPPYTKRNVSSTYSVSNILSNRSPLTIRHITRKSSFSSVHSLNSLRSEIGTNGPSFSQISVATQPVPAPSPDAKIVRKSSQRRHLRHNSVVPSGRGFMGLRLGKRSRAKA